MKRPSSAWVALPVLLVTAVGCAASSVHDGGAPPGACETALVGDAPFGAVLTGDVSFTVEGRDHPVDGTASLELYFPEGRVAGAPVVASGTGSYFGALEVVESVLDARGGAQIRWGGKSGFDDLYIDGTLVGDGGGLEATVHRNFAEPQSDVEVPGEGSARLCPSGALPAPVLKAKGCSGPTSAVRFSANVPVDPDSVAGSVADPDATFGGSDGGVYVLPDGAFPPDLDLALTVSASDRLGRPFTVEGVPRLLRTEGVVSDLGFATPPPEGAVDACVPFDVQDGALVFDDGYGNGPFDALVALPDAGGATALRVSLAWMLGCYGLGVDVVGADGSVSSAWIDGSATSAFDDGSEFAEATQTVALPSGRPLWLALRVQADRTEPQRLFSPACSVRLDEVAFE